jgi:hypothetical protein
MKQKPEGITYQKVAITDLTTHYYRTILGFTDG